jgi:hypothetical protein
MNSNDLKYRISEPDQLLTRVEMDEAIVGIRKDGIVHVFYKPGTIITVPLQQKMLRIFIELTNGEDKPFIWEGGMNVRVTKEARLYAAVMEKEAPCEATVVVVKNWYQRIIAEFYYRIHKPGMIYLVTKNFPNGIRWLQQAHNDAAIGKTA